MLNQINFLGENHHRVGHHHGHHNYHRHHDHGFIGREADPGFNTSDIYTGRGFGRGLFSDRRSQFQGNIFSMMYSWPGACDIFGMSGSFGINGGNFQKPGAANWQDHLKNGGRLAINFNNCNFSDSNYTGNCNTDPMGTLKAGQTYTLSYGEKTNSFTTTGFNQGTNGVGTWTYQNADMNKNEVSLWGRKYEIRPDRNGNLVAVDPVYGVVGTVGLS